MVDIYDDGKNPEGPNYKPLKRSESEVQRAVAVAVESLQKEGRLSHKITASGYGALAEQILQLAFENGVKVREDPDLAQMLAMMEVDSEIPAEALVALAEILSYIYKLNGEYKSKMDAANPENQDTPDDTSE